MVIFSATNNTLKIGRVIEKKLTEIGADITLNNITKKVARSKPLKEKKYEGIIFGFPIYAWRSPKPVREWIPSLNGEGKPCAMFFTYGGIHIGSAHYDTKGLLEEQGFRVIGSAEFVSKHAYNLGGWNVNVNRPNGDDFEVARQFAEVIFNRFDGKNPSTSSIPNPHISKNVLNRVRLSVKLGIKPPRFIKEQCTSCGVCEDLCPTGAIKSDLKEIAQDQCIKCFRCIKNCPENALKAPDLREQLEFTKQKNNLSINEINSKKSKIL